jgi:uncharacterized protein (DUF983 family)
MTTDESTQLLEHFEHLERRLDSIERMVWAIATHAGLAVDACPSCDEGSLQYRLDKSSRGFGRVRANCDTCEHEDKRVDEIGDV